MLNFGWFRSVLIEYLSEMCIFFLNPTHAHSYKHRPSFTRTHTHCYHSTKWPMVTIWNTLHCIKRNFFLLRKQIGEWKKKNHHTRTRYLIDNDKPIAIYETLNSTVSRAHTWKQLTNNALPLEFPTEPHRKKNIKSTITSHSFFTVCHRNWIRVCMHDSIHFDQTKWYTHVESRKKNNCNFTTRWNVL